MLLIDGVKYEEWTPTNEDEFEQIVKEHAKDIFGEQSEYFDIKHKIKSKSGIGSIPDGYVIILGNEPRWHIVEVELSSHPLYEHIVPQVSKFTNGIKNLSTRKVIGDFLHEEISKDENLRARIKSEIDSVEIYKFLSSLISRPPKLTIVIEKETEELNEAIEVLKLQADIVEFTTFVRKDTGISQHIHLFEPLVVSPPIDLPMSFLEEVRKRLIKRKPEMKPRKVSKNHFCAIPIKGHKGIHTEWTLWRKGEIGIELHLEREDRKENIRLLNEIRKSKDEFEKSIGEELIFDSHWHGRRWTRVYMLKPSEGLTEDLKEWAVQTMIKFYEVFKPLLDEAD
jgi:hypothetical protein